MLLNVLAHLLSATMLTRGYAPGLATALLVNLPFSLYLFRRARREIQSAESASVSRDFGGEPVGCSRRLRSERLGRGGGVVCSGIRRAQMRGKRDS